VDSSDPEEARSHGPPLPLRLTARDEDAVHVAWLIAALTAGLAGSRFFLDGLDGPIGWVLAAAALGFAVIPRVLARSGDPKAALGQVPVVGMAALSAMSLLEGGLRSEAMYWLPLVPIIAAVTRGPGRSTTVFAALGVALVGSLTLLEATGILSVPHPEALPMLLLRAGGLGGAVVGGAAVAFALGRAWTSAAESIARQAAYHPVTGLPSRTAFDAEVAAALARAERLGQRVAVAYIDLDRFKEVNDRLGHAAGDRVLRHVASQLNGATRSGERAFHLAGDEFAVVMEAIDPRQSAAPGRRISDVLSGLAVGSVEVSASVGVAVAAAGESAARLVSRADRAMYSAKAEGGGRSALADSGDWPRLSGDNERPGGG
jgi:diguanylate cyclase (GGDEF)-like protein